jgi:phage terminase large subunit-like protein
MPSENYATAAKRYAEAVVAGDILTCSWVQRACKRQLNDLAKFKGKASPYRFNPKLTDKDGRSFAPADNLCGFIERLPHVKGPLAGEMIKLEPWQVFILTTVFGWVKPDGKRRFRRSYIEVPRGNAKSTLSSALALYMLAADREGGAEVYSLATTRDQARIVFGDVQTMARQFAGFRTWFGVGVSAHNLTALRRVLSKQTAIRRLRPKHTSFKRVQPTQRSRSLLGWRLVHQSQRWPVASVQDA